MTQRSRAERRDDLLTALGMLADPIRKAIIEIDEPGTRIPYIRAQFKAEYTKFVQRLGLEVQGGDRCGMYEPKKPN